MPPGGIRLPAAQCLGDGRAPSWSSTPRPRLASPACTATADVAGSNPRYVLAATIVDPEVHAYLAEAVFAGPDGLDLIPTIVARAGELRRPDGLLVMEHDALHGSSVPDVVRADVRVVRAVDHLDLAVATAFRVRPPLAVRLGS